ncbi:MAG: hypothetical protein HN341_03595 [Verrucomicrobia bacterium]|jgi:hypothetical protein|nr:hypothetical protein [Verrucomicrobiota bacterium]
MPTNSGSGSYTTWVNGKDALFYGSGAQTYTATESISVGDIHWSGASGGLQVGNSASKITINGSVTTDNPQWFKFGGGIAGTIDISDVLYFQLIGNVAFDPGTEITLDDPTDLSRVDFYDNIASTDMTGLTLNVNGQGDSLNLREDALDIGAVNGNAGLMDDHNATANVTIQSLSPGSGASSTGIGNFTADVDDTINVTLGSGTHSFDVGAVGGVVSNDLLDVAGNVSGTITLGGTLSVSLIGSELAAGKTFDLFDASSISGSFASTSLPDISSYGLSWDTSQLAVDGTLSTIVGTDTMHFGNGSENPITVTGTRDWDTTSSFWMPTNSGSGSYTTWVNGKDAVFYGSGAQTITATESISVGDIHWSSAAAGFMLSSSGGKITVNGSITTDNPQWFKLGGSFAGTFDVSDVLYFQIIGAATCDPGTEITLDDPASLSQIVFWEGLTYTDFTDLSININGQGDTFNLRHDGLDIGEVNGNAQFIDNQNATANVTIQSLNPGVGATSAGIGLFTADAGDTINVTLGTGTHAFDIGDAGGAESNDQLNVTGSLTMDGTLNVTLLGSEISAGETFDLFDASSIGGTFAAVNLPDISADALEWDASQLYVDGSISTKNIDFYLGDGSTKPIVTTGTRAWDTTTANWLPDNSASGTYQAWSDGVNAIFVGALPSVTVTESINVKTISRESESGTATFATSGGAVVTILDSIDGGGLWFKVDGSIDGSFSITNIAYFLLTAGATVEPGTTITSDNGCDFFRFAWDTPADFSDLTLNVSADNLDIDRGNVVIGTMNGNAGLTGNKASFQVNSLNPGSGASSAGIGSVSASAYANDMVLGSGTHAFDIDYTAQSATNDELTLNGTTGDLTYGGTLNVTLLGGTLAPYATFDLFDAASFSGSFDTMNLPTLTGDMSWDTSKLTVDGSIRVFAPSGTVFRFQ